MVSATSTRQAYTVTAFIRPADRGHDLYSAYYREGLRRHLAVLGGELREVPMGRHPQLLGALRRVRDAYRLSPIVDGVRWVRPALDRLAAGIEGPVRTPWGTFVQNVSHYLFTPPHGHPVRVAIDSRDDGSLVDAEVLDWSDLYLKTNFWPTRRYPPKVRCLANADPLVIPQIARFRGYRHHPKDYDLCMVVRVWGGNDEVGGVEHNLRLIEAVSRAKCTKFLYAYLVAGDIEAARRRLTSQGIPCGTSPLPAEKLWKITAASRLNVIRLGMHFCLPWRFTGALALGSAIVLDRAPITGWPEPLVEGVHYLCLGAETSVDQPLAPEAQYAAIPERITAWLADGELPARVARCTGAYYDRFLAPERMGEHIVSAVESVAGEGRNSRAVTGTAA